MFEYISEVRDPVKGMDTLCQKCAAQFADRIDGDYVEGIVVGGYPKRQILHAWVEKDGNVYDVTNKRALQKSDYERVFQPEELHRESGASAVDRAARSGSWELQSRPKGWAEEGGILVPPTPSAAGSTLAISLPIKGKQ
jgi:hypothetical protein